MSDPSTDEPLHALRDVVRQITQGKSTSTVDSTSSKDTVAQPSAGGGDSDVPGETQMQRADRISAMRGNQSTDAQNKYA